MVSKTILKVVDAAFILHQLLFCTSVAGLKTALIEKFDFAAGTSSRSTKLIHGGVRYLQKAILGFDKEQVKILYSTWV